MQDDIPGNVEGNTANRWPFTAYDFFGYLIPGSIFAIAITIFESLTSGNADILVFRYAIRVLEAFNHSIVNEWLSVSIILISLLAITFVLGHIISSISSLFLDRILVRRCIGYPIKQLLNTNKPAIDEYWYDKFSRSIWETLYVVLNLIIIVAYIGGVFQARFLKYWQLITVLLISLFCVLAFVKILTNYLRGKGYKKWVPPRFLRFVRIIAIDCPSACFRGPINLFLSIIGADQAFSPSFIDEYNRKYKSFCYSSTYRGDEEVEGAESSISYWFPLIYLETRYGIVRNRLDNWRHIYSFARNTATAFWLAGVYCVSSLLVQDISFPSVMTQH